MRRLGWLGLVPLLWTFGCGSANGPGDGGHELDDGHIQSGCQTDPDCDDGQKCHTGHCDPSTRTCVYTDVSCPAPDDCNTSACDPKDGTCGDTPANESQDCTSQQGLAGTCTGGFCAPTPTCWDQTFKFDSLDCAIGFNGGVDYNDNDPFNVGSSATNAIDTYGGCATNETAPEVAYQFFNNTTNDFNVTVSLELQDTGGADGGVSDLDLIVLEDNCASSAVCVNTPLTGGGFQGITAGTSHETVTFRAKALKLYYIVVDGKNGDSASYKITVDACGKCQPSAANRLHCNQTMPVQGDTAQGSSQLGTYTCGAQTLTAAGSEQTFLFTTEATVPQNVMATVTNASVPVTLAAMPVNSRLECDPSGCLAGTTATGTAPNLTGSVQFAATPASTFESANYWISVDTPAAGSNTTYGLAFDCLPYCGQNDTIDCTNKARSSNNGASMASSVSAWGPVAMPCGGLNNLSGPEYVYLFAKPATSGTVYRFTLAALTDNKHLSLLILDAGATAPTSCDPNGLCALAAPQTVVANTTTLASTGSYLAAGPMTVEGGATGETAVVDLSSGTINAHYYWIVVDGVGGDVSDFALSIDSGCP